MSFTIQITGHAATEADEEQVLKGFEWLIRELRAVPCTSLSGALNPQFNANRRTVEQVTDVEPSAQLEEE